MSESINLLSEELEPKGYIPEPKVDSSPKQSDDLNKINETIVNSANGGQVNNLSDNPIANLNTQRPLAINNQKIIPKKVSFWGRLFGKKTPVRATNLMQQQGVRPTPNVTNLKANGMSQSSIGSAQKPKKGFDFKKILSWLTAGKKTEDQEGYGINLVQSEDEVLPAAVIAKRIFLRVLPAIIIIAGAYVVAQSYSVYVEGKTQALVSQLSSNIKISDNDIAKLEKNANGLDKKVTIMRNIFARHIYWTKLLDYLEQIFIAEVYIKSMTAEAEGNIIIDAQTDSFTSVAKQYILLQNNASVKEVSISGADRGSEDEPIKFTIKLKIWPGMMYPNAFTNNDK